MKQKVFLSDNDGTLTVARKPIRGEMAETLLAFAKHFKFAIVTGSPYKRHGGTNATRNFGKSQH